MSQVASEFGERKRPDPYADENTIVRRKRGVTIGAYQGLTIAALACLVGALFFLGVDTARAEGRIARRPARRGRVPRRPWRAGRAAPWSRTARRCS